MFFFFYRNYIIDKRERARVKDSQVTGNKPQFTTNELTKLNWTNQERVLLLTAQKSKRHGSSNRSLTVHELEAQSGGAFVIPLHGSIDLHLHCYTHATLDNKDHV
jgi:predicted amidohydrolase